MQKIKKGDNVKVMRGKSAGTTGEVLSVVTVPGKVEKTRVVVKGSNMMKKHQKPNPTLNMPGGVITVERPVDISNVMLIDPKTGTPTRVGIKIDPKTGKKARFAKKSGTIIK